MTIKEKVQIINHDITYFAKLICLQPAGTTFESHCPKCGFSAVLSNHNPSGVYRLYCRSGLCFKGADCIDVAMAMWNLSFVAAVNQLYGDGINTGNSLEFKSEFRNNHSVQSSVSTTELQNAKKEDEVKNMQVISSLWHNSQDTLGQLLAIRGIDLDALKKQAPDIICKIGFIDNCVMQSTRIINGVLSHTSYYVTGVVFKVSSNCFKIRFVHKSASGVWSFSAHNHFSKAMNIGKIDFFGSIAQSPASIIVCEGEFDALSLLQYGIPALSIGGCQNIDMLINKFGNSCEKPRVIIIFDADKAGFEASHSAEGKLIRSGFDAKEVFSKLKSDGIKIHEL